MHTLAHACKRTPTHVYASMHTCTQMFCSHSCFYTPTCSHADAYTVVHVCTFTLACTYLLMLVHPPCPHLLSCLCSHLCTYAPPWFLTLMLAHTCSCLCSHLCTHSCTGLVSHIRACMTLMRLLALTCECTDTLVPAYTRVHTQHWKQHSPAVGSRGPRKGWQVL